MLRLTNAKGAPQTGAFYFGHRAVRHQWRSSEYRFLVHAVNPPIFCLIALGGSGKSALAWKWFDQFAPTVMEPLAGRMWWSFYEAGTSFDDFVANALCYVSRRDEQFVTTLLRSEREELLLQYLSTTPYLIVLDGLERLLAAYQDLEIPSAAIERDAIEREPRRSAGPSFGNFLKKLTRTRQSKILITSRLMPIELETQMGHPLPGCFAHVLGRLSDADALDLWRAQGGSGSDEDVLSTLRKIDNHPLSVNVLASAVANYRRAPGDLAQWLADNSELDIDPLFRTVGTSLLGAVLDNLSTKPHNVLTTIADLKKATSRAELEALLVGPENACSTLEELDRALAELENRGLISWDRRSNVYDMHPVVRSVVSSQPPPS